MFKSKQDIINLVENVTDLIERFDSELRCVYCNKSVEIQLGISRESIIGKNPFEAGRIYERNNFIHNSLKDALKKGKIQEVEQCMLTLGGMKYFNTRIIPEKNEEGKVESLLAISRDITECKQIEENMRETNSRLDLAMQTLNMTWWEMDIVTGQVIFDNRKTEMFGYPTEYFRHYKDFMKLVHHEDQNRVMDTMKKYIDKATDGYETEYRILTSAGEYRWFYDKVSVVKKDSKDISTRIIVFVLDITERKEREKKIKFEQEFTARILKKMGAGFSAIDSYGKQHFVNDELCRMTGFTEPELLEQKPPFKYWAEEGIQEIKYAFIKTLQGIEETYELLFKRKNCERFIALVIPRKIKDVEGRTIFILTILDITYRKQVERALYESEEIFNQFMKHSPILISFRDKNLKTVRLSNNYEKMLGLSMNELLGKNMNELFPSDLAKKMSEDDMRVLLEGVPIQIEEEFNGRFYSTMKFPIHRCGIPYYIVGFTIDITERKKKDEMRLRLEKLESIGSLAGGIAHEFNNLFSCIFGFIELAQSESDNAKVVHYLSKVMSNLSRARRLTQQLLTFAKGGAPLRKNQPLLPFIQETVRSILPESSVICKFNISEPDSLCSFDKNQLRQVIINMVNNARESMHAGGTIEISLKNKKIKSVDNIFGTERDFVEISIKDRGTGIPKEILPKIFDPFFTTDRTKSGLGLSVCHSIINRHDGWIEVQSEPGIGCTFQIYLPACKE